MLHCKKISMENFGVQVFRCNVGHTSYKQCEKSQIQIFVCLPRSMAHGKESTTVTGPECISLQSNEGPWEPFPALRCAEKQASDSQCAIMVM